MARIFLILFWGTVLHLGAQVYTGDYRSPSNPHYWKNKQPREGYWQQDVHYRIEASLDDSNDVISGKQTLTYYNNSPNTLQEIFFHVNENAFTPGSYYHNLHLNNHSKPKFGKNAAKGLGTVVSQIEVDGTFLTPVLDNTVFKVSLPRALKPNDSITISMNFATYFDIDATMRRRMKNFKTLNNLKHFDVVHWYPQVCVYDAKFGWTTDQHLDKEFYNNFGTFEVNLNLPKHYVLDGTGTLLNENEVYPDSLKKQLKLSNFFNRKPSDPISVPIPYTKELKTWKFRAVNVHNFAFSADPLYRIDEVEWKGIKSIALVQEQNAPRWKDAAKFAMNVIRVYSEDFGMYAWPKIIVADAKDGMEYPMITLDNGFYPQNQQLLAHEIGHMWFYGMLGSNETYRASMDEGFTQFLTIWCMDKLGKPVRERLHDNKFIQKRLKPYITRFDRLYNPYIITAHKGYDEQLNTHSCAFHGALRHGGNYGLVYYKTGVMLYNLKYVLGDSLFLSAMQHYVQTWKMAHPYPEDFRHSVINHTHNDLNWFFDQWLESTKTLDYQVNKPQLLRSPNKDSLLYELSFCRKGRMQSPLDVTVTDITGKKYNYHIPNTWFQKKTTAQVLPKWYGWDLLQPQYKVRISLPNKIATVAIDTSLMLADIDLRNNRWHKKNPVKFNYFIPNSSTWDKTDKLIRPDLWYNAYDGLQLGFNFSKKYFASLTDYDFNVYLNSTVAQGSVNEQYKAQPQPFPLSYTFYSKSNFNKYLKYSYLTFYSNFIAGMVKNGITIEKVIRKQDDQNPRTLTLGANVDEMYRPELSDYNYLLFNPKPPVQKLHNTLNIFADKRYILHKKLAALRFDLRSPFLLSEFNYYYLQAQHLYNTTYKKLEFRTRLFSRLVHAPNGFIPTESSLMIAGGNLEDTYTNKFYRARGLFPQEWQQYSNSILTHMGGGLNIRGLSNLYYASLYSQGMAQSGISGNFEMDFEQIFKIKPIKRLRNFSVDLYAFVDGACYNDRNINLKATKYSLAADVGLGSIIKINFGSYDIKPLYLRFDFPLWVGSSTQSNPKTIMLMGIGRAF